MSEISTFKSISGWIIILILLAFTVSCTKIKDTSLKSISVSPEKINCKVNTFVKYNATGLYADKSTEILTAKVKWTDDSTNDHLFTNNVPGLANLKKIGSFVISAKYTLDSSNDISGYTYLVVRGADSTSGTSDPQCEDPAAK